MTKKHEKTIALVSLDQVGRKMAGTGMRYFELAKTLSNNFQVILFVPNKCDLEISEFQLVQFNPKKQRREIGKYISEIDVIIAQNLLPELLWDLNRNNVKIIADLYDPLLIETLEYEKDTKITKANRILNFQRQNLLLQLNFANHILYANERQRDYYLGVLSGSGILNPDFYSVNSFLEQFITHVPFGLSDEKISGDKGFLEKKFSGIKKDDFVILWGGGIWNWFDPLTLISAFELIKNPKIKLVFLGTGHPNPKIKKMKIAGEAFKLAEKNGTLNRCVFFNDEWVDYEERKNYLISASCGVSTHFNNIETHFSFRTRILDYFWAELPMILTKGDYFAELCQEKNLGVVVDYKNFQEIADGLELLANNKNLIEEIKSRIIKVKEDFYWSNIAQNIVQIVEGEKWAKRKINLRDYQKLKLNFYISWVKKNLNG